MNLLLDSEVEQEPEVEEAINLQLIIQLLHLQEEEVELVSVLADLDMVVDLSEQIMTVYLPYLVRLVQLETPAFEGTHLEAIPYLILGDQLLHR